MATKFVLVSLLLLQLAVTAFSGVAQQNPHHQPHGKQKTAHEPGGPAGGIPKPGSKPQVPFGGADEAPHDDGPASGGPGKKWCIAKTVIQKSLLKKDFDDLCKEVDCSPTDGKGLCYTESIQAKASFAMNLKYQKNGKKDADCNYGGRAEIVTKDPSWAKCVLVSN
ncbi:major pollen allergen Ole e 10-like [Rosa rugosa]|uniref:major pollen allergen Ole e 10-like n=1 Tax=Rosa rugosa TaxID=74645 RepID=UPI002B40A713|nr:major pollen allergen Ole e 10-like [Rosa rugosa]